MFFGAVVRPGKAHALVPHSEGFALHLSQASLAPDVKAGTRAAVLVKLGPKEQAVVLCTLSAGNQDTVLLDQFFTEYAELSIQGSVPVHVTGYYSPQYGPHDDDDDDEGEEDEEYEMPGHPLDLMAAAAGGRFGAAADSDDSDGDEDEDDSMDEDESDDDEGESDDSADVVMGARGRHGRKEPSVIIEDITDQENAKAAGKVANGDASKDGKKRKAAAAQAEGAAAKKQAVAAAAAATPQQQPAKQQQQQQQKTPADKKQQQQQQQKTPADKKQQQQQKTPDSKAAAAAAGGVGSSSPAAQSVPSGKKSVRVFENGFEIHNTKMGDPHGKLAKGGKVVKVRYVGRLKSNGKVFDKTDKKPFAFRLGVGEVIKGWDRGVEGMRTGDKRKLVIPPQMGYGSQRSGPIPANSWLEFDVELLDVK